MSEHSAIGWTDASWNPVTGCSHVSPGCENCYAETLSLRMGWSTKPWTAQNAQANVVLHHNRINEPLKWKASRRVFVNSMSDLFHELVPDTFIDEVFAVMAAAKRHQFQILTKRPARMLEYCLARLLGLPLPNVWLGVSVEDQRRAEERIPLLLKTPAAVRFISAEPLLGPIELVPFLNGRGLDWVIVGGESGPGYRPMEPWWLSAIATECFAWNVPLFVKQDSGPKPDKQGRLSDGLWMRKEYPPVAPA